MKQFVTWVMADAARHALEHLDRVVVRIDVEADMAAVHALCLAAPDDNVALLRR